MRALVAVLVAVWSGTALADSPAHPMIDLAAVAPPSPSGRPWPLSELPSLQPHLDLAMAHDACTPDAQKRARDDEVRAYLAAWCRIRAGEREAVDALGKLAREARKDVAHAALLDVVNLVADFEAHQPAIAHLQRLSLLSTANLDLLAATYLALGQHDDAFFVGWQAMRDDSTGSEIANCERWLAWKILDEDNRASFSPSGHAQHDACDRLRATWCAMTRALNQKIGVGARVVSMRECFVELPDDPDRDGKLAVIAAWAAWPGAVKAPDWFEVARTAETALSVRGAENLVVSALELAYQQTCDGALLDAIAAATKRLSAADFHDGAFDQRLAALRVKKRCRT
jgi:hypothetical protein